MTLPAATATSHRRRPAWRFKVNEVARRVFLPDVRVGGKERRAAVTARDRPRVAPDRRGETHEEGGCANPPQRITHDAVDRREIEAARNGGYDAFGRKEHAGPVCAHRGHQPGAEHFVESVAARHERVRTIQQVFGAPELRRPAGEHEFLGQPLARPADPGIDAAGKGPGNGLGVRPVSRPLVVDVASNWTRRVIESRSMNSHRGLRQPALTERRQRSI